MSDSDIASNMKKLTEQIRAAEVEVKATGDMTYSRQLRKFYRGFAKERDARLQIQAEGGKIVKKPGDVKTAVLDAPPKTLEEIEE